MQKVNYILSASPVLLSSDPEIACKDFIPRIVD